MISFETIIVWTALFRELWVAVRTFTRRGRAWLTPLLGATYAINAMQARNAEPSGAMRFVGFALLVAALTLLEWASFSIRGRMFSYLGSKDTPEFIFTGGPYGSIRHPFYTCYILTHLAIFLIFPTRVTAAVAIFTAFLLWNAAQFEESKFAESPLAAPYQSYVAKTGRFFPRFSR